MKAYPAYKRTDQLWLPIVPEGWETIKIKYAFNERSEKGYPDEPLLVASQNMGVVPKGIYGNRTVEAQKDLHLLKLVKIGDFVISLRSFQGGIEYAYYQGIISPAYTIMTSMGSVTTDYFKHLAKSHAFIELLQMCVTGIREGQNIDYGKLKNYRIPLPSRGEQIQIARYLDWKISAINKLVNAKRKQIALLEEKRRSFTFYAVTHGLNASAQKDKSDVYWLDSMPVHWNSLSVAQLFKQVKNKNSGMQEKNLLSLSYGRVKRRDINATSGLLPENFEGYNIIEAHDIVLRLTDLQNDQKSLRTGLSKERGIVTSAYLSIRNISNNSSEYLQLVLHAFDLTKGFYNYGASGVRQGLNWDALKPLKLPIPPLSEQINIVSAINKEDCLIDSLISTIQKEIDVLVEYKTRLISDVVTGQIDIRGVDIPAFESVDELIVEENADDDIGASEVG